MKWKRPSRNRSPDSPVKIFISRNEVARRPLAEKLIPGTRATTEDTSPVRDPPRECYNAVPGNFEDRGRTSFIVDPLGASLPRAAEDIMT